MSDRLPEEALVDLETKLANVDNDYTPVCKDSRWSYGCGGPTDETHAFWQAAVECIPKMIAEIRERRAADLTDEDRKVFAWIRWAIGCRGQYGAVADHERAIEFLDKFTGRK